MKKLLLVPALLVACGDNLHPEEDQVTVTSEGDHDDDTDDPPARAIEAQIFIETITCDETIARFEAGARYDDGTPLADMQCKWTFDDGTTSTVCAGEHLFDRAGAHDFVLEVTDAATGAMGRSTQTRQFHPPFEANLEVSGDGLSITYRATSNTGGEGGVTILPHELVIDADGSDRERTVRVREPGTYTVIWHVEDERGVSEICSASIEKQITLVCEGDVHAR
jgi:hypothetical protein